MNRLLILLSLAAVLELGACSKKELAQPAPEHKNEASSEASESKRSENVLRIDESMLRDLKLKTAPVEERSEGESTAILGELRVDENRYAEVGVPIPSRVVRVAVAPGDRVRQGQLLAILQSSEVGRAKSEVMSATSRLELASRVLERKRRLGNERIVAQRDVQEAEAGVAAAESDVRSAKANLQALGISASDSEALASGSPQYELRSPISGTVIDRAAIQGQMGEPTQPLFRVGDLSILWLTIHAYERDALRIRVGSVARVVFPALPGETFSGRVTLVGKQVEPDSRTIPVRIEITNRDGRLRSGMSATAWLPISSGASGKILSVPAASLQRIAGKWVVFKPVPNSGDSFEIQPVGRGRDLSGEVEVISGLRPGDTVVVDGAFLLKAQAERSSGEGEEHDDH